MCETSDDTLTVRQFVIKCCGCRLNCHTTFEFDNILSHILSIWEMTKEEKELSCIMSLVTEGNDEKTKRGKKAAF
jgi:hypothetical protein